MTITKALRKLYKVIVGEEAPANANTITKVLLALAEAWTGGGGSGGGGSEPLIVNLVYDGGNPRLDKTWQQIYDAMPNVTIQDDHGSNGWKVPISKMSFNVEAREYLVYIDADNYVSTTADDYPTGGED